MEPVLISWKRRSQEMCIRDRVKTAHYWAAGLPVVIPRGVSDDHRIAEEEHVGIAVDDLPTIDPGPFLNEMRRLLEGDRQQLRERCVATARRYRDSSRMVELLQRSLASDQALLSRV